MFKALLMFLTLSVASFSNTDILESYTTNDTSIKENGRYSIKKVCIDGHLFILVISSSGVTITESTMGCQNYIKSN